MSDRIKVLGAGSALLDLLARVPDSFLRVTAGVEKGGMLNSDESGISRVIAEAEKIGPVTRAIGGSAGNTVFGLSRLGVPTAYLAKIGNDADGAYYRDAYAALGGDISRFKVNPTQKTGRCLSLITPDSERTMLTDLGASATLRPDEIAECDFDGVTHLMMEGYLLYNLPVFRRILSLAKKSGCFVCLDLSSFGVVRTFRTELTEALRSGVDLVFANEDEAREFCGMPSDSFNPEKALDMLAGYCSVAAVKLGRKGALIRRDGKTYSVEARLVDAVDTTGAGDLWQCGFLYGLLRGETPDLCGRYAAVTASEVVRVTGAQIPADRWEFIRAEFMKMKQTIDR